MSAELQKYHKLFERLELNDSVLCRKLFNHTGQEYTRQYVVPSHMRKELIYRHHNSKFPGHTGITKTIEKFRQASSVFFLEFLVNYVRNCPPCLQIKPVKTSSL